MCMDAMEFEMEPEVVQPCSYQKKKFTKWKPRKCFSGGGKKSLLKWKRNSIHGSRKYRQGLNQTGKRRHGNRRLFIVNRADCKKLHPGNGRTIPGMQAPRNTTQYLMHLVYQDLVNDSVKRQDSEFESSCSTVASDFDTQYMGPELLYYEAASSQSTCCQSNIDL